MDSPQLHKKMYLPPFRKKLKIQAFDTKNVQSFQTEINQIRRTVIRTANYVIPRNL